MAEVCLRALGWRTEFLGNDLPTESFCKAIVMYKPSITVISMSALYDEIQLVENLLDIEDCALENDCSLVLGGRTLPGFAEERIKRSIFVKSMSDFLDKISEFTASAQKAENA